MVSVPRLRPLRIGEILDVSIKLYLKNAGTLFKVVLVVVAPIQLLSVLITASTVPDGLKVAPGDQFGGLSAPSADIESGELGAFLAGQGIVLILAMLTVVLATGACFKAISDAYLGEQPDWRESLRFAFRRLHSLIFITSLSSILAALALVAFIIPGVYLWVAWAVAIPALMIEGTRGRSALKRSRRLVKDRWWSTFGALLVGFLLAGVLSSIVQGIFAIGALAADDESSLAGIVANGIASTIGSMLATPFQAAVVCLLYFDLRVRKEGFDLELLARQIGVTRSPDAEPAVPSYQPAVESGVSAAPPYWPPPPGWTPPAGAERDSPDPAPQARAPERSEPPEEPPGPPSASAG